ncbi:MAG TPA: hypothetical protein VL200_11985 [Lacunisphaera sp.]|jgi:hypothetical protein|nr:hypothetical protein [Lacunisphaera sp.]
MKSCRLVINVLAIAEALLGAIFALGLVAGFTTLDLAKLSNETGTSRSGLMLVCVGATLLFGGLAFVYLRAGLRYGRDRDRKTATHVASVFCFTLGFVLFSYATLLADPRGNGVVEGVGFVVIEALLMGSAWVLYRLVLKPVIAHGFPDDPSAPPLTPAASLLNPHHLA